MITRLRTNTCLHLPKLLFSYPPARGRLKVKACGLVHERKCSCPYALAHTSGCRLQSRARARACARAGLRAHSLTGAHALTRTNTQTHTRSQGGKPGKACARARAYTQRCREEVGG
eukprot:274585-Pleurochrysis_carterae.AAC.1